VAATAASSTASAVSSWSGFSSGVGAAANTDGRQIHIALDEMGAAVPRKDIDGLFRHIADDFRVRSLDRKTFRDLVQRAMARTW
jgi:hypothetical protein